MNLLSLASQLGNAQVSTLPQYIGIEATFPGDLADLELLFTIAGTQSRCVFVFDSLLALQFVHVNS